MQNVGVYSQRLQELRDPLIFVNLDVARRRWDFHRAQGDVLQTAVRSVNKRGVELPKVLHLEAILENFPQMSRIDGREWCEPPVFGGRGRKWKCTLCGLRRCLGAVESVQGVGDRSDKHSREGDRGGGLRFCRGSLRRR
jgi:hypothetical protein